MGLPSPSGREPNGVVSTVVHGRGTAQAPSYGEELAELLRVIVVAGIPLGIVVGGIGSRLAMLLLRLTSPDSLRGTLTDDEFVVGDVTLAGTYNLLVLGAAMGVIGAAAYVAVSPWLVGPQWFRSVTVGITAGALVGALVIHPTGRDFTLLEPTWLAASLFIALPAAFGVLLVYAVDGAARPGHWAARDERRLLVPGLLLLLVVPVLFVGIPVALVVAALLPVRRALLGPIRASAAAMLVIRGAFLTIPVLAIIALVADLRLLR